MRRGDQLLAIGSAISRQEGLRGFEAWRDGLPADERVELDEAIARRTAALNEAVQSMRPLFEAYQRVVEEAAPGITRLAQAIVAARGGAR